MNSLLAMLLLAGGPSPGTPWHPLLGDWSGHGTLFGQPVEASLRFESALGGHFVRLEYEARTQAGNLMFSGEGLYSCCDTSAVRGSWADSAGHLYPITGRFEGGRLETEWGDPAIELGRSTYDPAEPDTLRVTDRVLRGQTWEPFAEIEYVRDTGFR